MAEKRKAVNFFIVGLTVLVGACATTGSESVARFNTLDSIKSDGVLSEGKGIVVISAGRKKKGLTKEDGTNWAGILPFVSYHILRLESGLDPVPVAFLPAENGFGNQIGDQDYGFVHFRELEAGDYLAVGDRSRGRDVVIAGGGYFMTMGPGSRSTDIAFKFSVDSGVVNYLGELVTVNGELKNSSIRVSDESDRDIEFVSKKFPSVADYEVRKMQPAFVDPDTIRQ